MYLFIKFYSISLCHIAYGCLFDKLHLNFNMLRFTVVEQLLNMQVPDITVITATNSLTNLFVSLLKLIREKMQFVMFLRPQKSPLS